MNHKQAFCFIAAIMLAVIVYAACLGASAAPICTGCRVLTETANADSDGPDISDDSTVIAYRTTATNIIGGGNPNPAIIVDVSGTPELGSGSLTVDTRPSVSRDGLFVAFYGRDGTNQRAYVYDVAGNTLEASPEVAVFTTDDPPPVVSDYVNGARWVAFRASGSSYTQIKVWKVGTSIVRTVSFNSSGNEASASCSYPTISADGLKVAYVSNASNLTGYNGYTQVYIAVYGSVSLSFRTNEVVSVFNGSTTPADADSGEPDISADATHVAFSTLAELNTEDTYSGQDVYVRFRSALSPPTTKRAYINLTSETLDNWSRAPRISSNGRWVSVETANRRITPAFIECGLNGEHDGDPFVGPFIMISDTQNAGTQYLVSFRMGEDFIVEPGFQGGLSDTSIPVATFSCPATHFDLCSGDDNDVADVYARDDY